jgi:hypothetical protein
MGEKKNFVASLHQEANKQTGKPTLDEAKYEIFIAEKLLKSP